MFASVDTSRAVVTATGNQFSKHAANMPPKTQRPGFRPAFVTF